MFGYLPSFLEIVEQGLVAVGEALLKRLDHDYDCPLGEAEAETEVAEPARPGGPNVNIEHFHTHVPAAGPAAGASGEAASGPTRPPASPHPGVFSYQGPSPNVFSDLRGGFIDGFTGAYPARAPEPPLTAAELVAVRRLITNQ